MIVFRAYIREHKQNKFTATSKSVPSLHPPDGRYPARYKTAIEPIVPPFAAPSAPSETAPLALANPSDVWTKSFSATRALLG